MKGVVKLACIFNFDRFYSLWPVLLVKNISSVESTLKFAFPPKDDNFFIASASIIKLINAIFEIVLNGLPKSIVNLIILKFCIIYIFTYNIHFISFSNASLPYFVDTGSSKLISSLGSTSTTFSSSSFAFSFLSFKGYSMGSTDFLARNSALRFSSLLF